MLFRKLVLVNFPTSSTQNGAKLGLQLWVCKTQLFVVLLLINYCVTFHTTTINLLCPTPPVQCPLSHTPTVLGIRFFVNVLVEIILSSFNLTLELSVRLVFPLAYYKYLCHLSIFLLHCFCFVHLERAIYLKDICIFVTNIFVQIAVCILTFFMRFSSV